MRYLVDDKDKDKRKGKGKIPRETTNRRTDQITYENLYFPSHKVQCDSCEKDITKYTKINFGDEDYCVSCFASLHKFPQTYQVTNKLNFPVFDIDWTAEEELLMFEGLQRHGFGNWADIAEHIGTDKTKDDVERHYEEVYLSNDNFLPTNRQVLSKRDDKTLKLITPRVAKTQQKKAKKARDLEGPVSNTGRGNFGTTSNPSSVVNTGHAGDIVGYMPKRGEFQVEYDNDAELLLAEMEFNDDDTAEEQAMKFKLLDIYNYKLNERAKRKEFVIKRNLLDIKYQTNLEKNRTKDEKEIFNMMKVFARFNTPEDHDKLVEGIIKEKQIRQRIEELRQYKKLGLKTFAQVEEYLEEKRKKDEIRIKKLKTTESSYLYDSKIKTNVGRRTRTTSNFEGGKPEKRSQFITSDETKVCEKLDLPIPIYIAIKQTLVRECVKDGFIKRDALDEMVKVDKEKVVGVFDFLVQNNVLLEK